MQVYIKRQWRRARLLPRPTDLRHRIGVKCSPIHEWRGLRILQSVGLHVAEPLALFWQGWGFSRGAVVTRAVPPAASLADMIARNELQAMTADRQQSLIGASVEVIRRLHRARISWRSLKAKHFYPEELRTGQWRIWLIDCEGVYRWASRRDCQREWHTFLHSLGKDAASLKSSLLRAYDKQLAA